MARHKNATWNLEEPSPGMDGAQLAALMDIRDELQKLNAVFACGNFQSIPRELRAINRELKIIRKATVKP